MLAIICKPAIGDNPEYRCAGCGEIISKQAVVVDGKLYHTECFRCAACNEPIRDEYLLGSDSRYYHRTCLERITHTKCNYCGEYITASKSITVGDKIYHEKCYYEFVAPRCDICGEPLEGSYITDFWGSRFHPRHTKEFPVCQVCGRLIWQGGYEIDKGRWLCPVCRSMSVTSPERIRGLLEEVREELARMGIVVKTLGLRINMVDREHLDEGRTPSGHSHAYAHVIWKSGTERAGDETATINVLNGMPEDMMRGIIAHELMHVWQNENQAGEAPIEVREGSANWASSLIYSRMQTKRGQFFLNSLEKSTDPVYGKGYNEVSKYADREGVQAVLYLLKTGGELKREK
jgi:hypothetical protein